MTEKVVTNPRMSTSQLRKIKKPIIERRRRERINDSLCQLKALVLEATNKEESRYSKMEKADILEMTVRHLKQRQHDQQLTEMSEQSQLVTRYQTGFSECAREVTRCLEAMVDMNVGVKSRLVQHLARCLQRISNDAAATSVSPVEPAVNVQPPPSSSFTTNVNSMQQKSHRLSESELKNSLARESRLFSLSLPANSSPVVIPTIVLSPPTSSATMPILSPVSLSPNSLASSSSSSLPQSPRTPVSPLFNNVIPLYATPSSQTLLHRANANEDHAQNGRRAAFSPHAGDDVPASAKLPLRPNDVISTRGMITDHNNNNVQVIVSHPAHIEQLVSPGSLESMWRPW